MRTIQITCDVSNRDHEGEVTHKEIPVMYENNSFEVINVDICEGCFKYFTENRILPLYYPEDQFNPMQIKLYCSYPLYKNQTLNIKN